MRMPVAVLMVPLFYRRGGAGEIVSPAILPVLPVTAVAPGRRS